MKTTKDFLLSLKTEANIGDTLATSDGLDQYFSPQTVEKMEECMYKVNDSLPLFLEEKFNQTAGSWEDHNVY